MSDAKYLFVCMAYFGEHLACIHRGDFELAFVRLRACETYADAALTALGLK